MDVTLAIAFAAAGGGTATGAYVFAADVTYLRAVRDPEEGTENVPTTTRVMLDETFDGDIVLKDAADSKVTVAALSSDGATLKIYQALASNGAVTVELDKTELARLADAAQQLPSGQAEPKVTRVARLVPTSDIVIDFSRTEISVISAVTLAALTALGVTSLQHDNGTKVASLEVTGQDLDQLRAVAWEPAYIGVDGVLTARFERRSTVGWLWWMTGSREIVGFIPDDLSGAEYARLVVPLPALSVAPTTPTLPNEHDEGDRVPAGATEAEIVNNPHIFTEDPGAFCRPFSNPERVVSEKSFSVIARVTQPDIGGAGTVRTHLLSNLSLDALGDVAADRSPGLVSRILNRSTAPMSRVTRVSLDRFNSSIVPTRHQLASTYLDLIRRLPVGRGLMSANRPLQWEDDIAQYQAASVALGHILEYRIRTFSNGYSLGTVASTLTLAPRQTKRIQKIEWERHERAVRSERTQLLDRENDAVLQERDYQDTVAANLNEWARGGSSSSAGAIAGGIGFFAGGVLGGIGGGATSAHSTSHQSGGRDTNASEQQRLRDSIRRHGDALRKLESTVVAEVTQEETVTGTTEVIRNANYEHSLTVIYYQILRHLKVMTEFAGVRECLFVPFSVKPFDVHRAYRWRESLQASMRTPRFARALRHLKDVATGFTTSDIDPGTRARQRLTFVRGSIYVSLGVERPLDTSDGLFSAINWGVAQPLLDTPARGIFSFLASLGEAARDRTFQAEHAPGMAARWADRLRLRLGNRDVHADFTLATRYQFNRGARIDFVIPSSELTGLSREQIQSIQLVSTIGLPPGSVANLTRLSLTYNTARFEHSVAGLSGTNDLVAPMTGSPGSATVGVPLDPWELVNERLEISRAVEELIEHLNEHVEYYTKAIMWRMDRDRLLMLLDGFYVPNTNNVAIASIVDREPLGIIGNSLVYRVGAASFIGSGKVKTPADLYNVYADSEPVSDPVLISLPTDGLYAQTIMDGCGALEEHYGSTDWVLSNPEPGLGEIDPSLLMSRVTDSTEDVKPTPFPATIINLQNAPRLPDPSGFADAFDALTNQNAFRDMAGLAGTQANAAAALNTAAGLATNFGNQAAALEMAKLAKAQQATKTADQKLASINRAVEKGLATPQDAAKATKDVLLAMNPDSSTAVAPHENPAITSAINAAKGMPGSTIEATTGEGIVRVAMAGGPGAANRPLERVCGFFGPNDVVVSHTDLVDRIAADTVAERDSWWQANAAGTGVDVITEGVGSQFGELVAYWLASKGQIRPTTLQVVIQNARALPEADYGHLLKPVPPAPASTSAQITAAVNHVRPLLLSGAPDTNGPADLDRLIEDSLRSANRSARDLEPGGAWSAVFVSACVRTSAIGLGLEGFTGTHVGRNELFTYSSAHRLYTVAAYQARFGPIARHGCYHAFEIAEHAPQIGDIIVQDRRAGIAANQVVAFSDIPTVLPNGIQLHGDIVVDVPAGGGHVVTIGGNLGHSSRIRHYPLDANNRLVVAAAQEFVREDDTAVIAALPSAAAANNPLTSESTARIFAILSPVELCAVVPGQEFNGGVIA